MSEVQTVPVPLNVPKESKDVADAALSIIKDVLAKKSAAEIAAGALPKAIAAADGFALISGELKDEHRADLAGYLVRELLSVLAPVKA